MDKEKQSKPQRHIYDDIPAWHDFKRFKLQAEESGVPLKNVTFNPDSHTSQGDRHYNAVRGIINQQTLLWLLAMTDKYPEVGEGVGRLSDRPLCLDVGSNVSLVTMLAAVVPFMSLKPEKLELLDESYNSGYGYLGKCPELNMDFISGEAQNIPLDSGCVTLLTSINAIGHFGLGRYGDTIDVRGDIHGLQEMHRVLKPGGRMLGATQVVFAGDEKIDFNSTRIYSPGCIKKMIQSAGFQIVNEFVVTGLECTWVDPADPEAGRLITRHTTMPIKQFNDTKEDASLGHHLSKRSTSGEMIAFYLWEAVKPDSKGYTFFETGDDHSTQK